MTERYFPHINFFAFMHHDGVILLLGPADGLQAMLLDWLVMGVGIGYTLSVFPENLDKIENMH
tara:strand:+ start:212 stop:400 length:189 start_codon:yes stop_codon:yes gene_type:complete